MNLRSITAHKTGMQFNLMLVVIFIDLGDKLNNTNRGLLDKTL